MKRMLNSDEQLDKLNLLAKLAESATKSIDLDRRLGAFTIHAGMVDFLVIQFARVIEQIILKGQVAQTKIPTFQPHPDKYFYDQQISTRSILKEAKRLLPFKAQTLETNQEAEKINSLADQFITTASKFLNYRNPIIHHIGSPQKSFDEIKELCEKSEKAYTDFIDAQKLFFEMAAPYRFGEEELKLFYGS